MNHPFITIRLMQEKDLAAIIRIDEKILKSSRPAYYEQRFEKLFRSGEYVPTSLVAETEDRTLVGFIMGELYIGEYGISGEGASVDTVGVDPEYQCRGIGLKLMTEFVDHLRELGVQKINTLVDRNDVGMMQYFNANGFTPSKAVINLERMI
jgi:ribosomal protein S18 acetylase RimI-like enzyme